MTSDSKKSHTHGSLANKSSSSLIIHLPSTSANRVPLGRGNQPQANESEPSGCRQAQANARLLPAVQSANNQTTGGAFRLSRLEQQQQQREANTANLTPNQHRHHRHQQHRISQHRYEQHIAHNAIDHHLVQTHDSTAIGGARSLDSDHSSGSGTPPPNYHEIPGIVPSYHGRSSGPPPAYDDVVNPNAAPPSYQSLFGQVREARKRSNGLVDLLRQLFLVLIGTLGCTMIIGFLLLIPITMIFIGVFYMNECRAENIPSFLVVGGFVWILKNVLNCYNQFKKDSTTINRPPPPRRRPIGAQTGATSAPPPATSSSGTAGDGLAANSSSQAQSAPTTISVPIAIGHTSVGGGQTHAAGSTAPASTPASTTTRSAQSPQHVRHPPMIGITSYKCESILNYFLIVWFLAGCIVVYRIYEPDYENPLSLSYCNRTVYLYAFWLMTSAFIVMAIILSCLCCLMASSLISCGQNG